MRRPRSLDRAARARLKALVKGLPRAHRDALLLVATQELTYAEAAALLDVPVGTVKWRVSDARRMLRERMQRQEDGLRQSAVGLREDGRQPRDGLVEPAL